MEKTPSHVTPEPDDGSINGCKLCPKEYNDLKLITNEEDLHIHNQLWHNTNYSPEICHICQFRAMNKTFFDQIHNRVSLLIDH